MTVSATSLHIVVTCANRKRHRVPTELQLGDVTARPAARRFSAWTHRLDSSTSDRYPALDLYSGEHWAVVRELANSPAAKGARLWIASAGYGLIPADADICAYAATFANSSPDAVGPSLAAVADWWQRLSTWPGPAPNQPRSFTQLAQRDRSATVIAVLSEAYQRACANDLLAAADLFGPNALSVVGPPAAHGPLADVLVPVTATLRHTVGGSLQALNVRATKHLLEHGDGAGRTALRAAAAAAAPAAPPAERPAGQRVTDAEVAAYIRGNTHTSATQLLRHLRATGRSCEQHRFANLHRDVCEVHRP